MATDGPTPPPCNPEIFEKGECVCILAGSSNAIEKWVTAVANKANARVDWHYRGGRANVLHLGDAASRKHVLNIINNMKDELEGYVISISCD